LDQADPKRFRFFNKRSIQIFIVYNVTNILIWDGNGKEWEFPHGNSMGMEISEKNGKGMGGNVNR